MRPANFVRALALVLLVLAGPATALALSPHGVHHVHRSKHRKKRPRTHRTIKRVPVNHHRGGRHRAVTTAVSPPPTISGTTYYVSPSGSDSNSGTSPSSPWKTVAKVNATTLNPGDGVLFQGGHTFSDATLQPNASGTSGHPIVYGSYDTGQPNFTYGAYFVGKNYLTLDDLDLLGSVSEGTPLQGGNSRFPANHIVLENSTLQGQGSSVDEDGMYTHGSNWTIKNNRVENTGDSGMVVVGDTYLITGNTITDTGQCRACDGGVGKHGIYTDASNATITGNTITNSVATNDSDLVTIRYRNSVVENNTLSGAYNGISFYEQDTSAGTAHWKNNKISNTSQEGIYISSTDAPANGGTGNTIENFTIENNTIVPPSPLNGWVQIGEGATTGTYTVSGNVVP